MCILFCELVPCDSGSRGTFIMRWVDMDVKFGYCVICHHGPDGTNREWVDELMRGDKVTGRKIVACKTCSTVDPTNKNRLCLKIKIPETGMKHG